MDKIGRYGKNKAQRFYRCCSDYALRIEDLWTRENPESPEFTMVGLLARIQERQGLY